MNTMEVTKVVAGICGTFLVLLLLKWGAESIYSSDDGGHGEATHAEADHGESAEATTETAQAATASEEAPAEESVDLGALVAAADLAKGERVFKKCKACHKLEDGANGTGPHMFSVVGRAIGGIDGFGYSSAMAEKGGDWDYAALDAFFARPKDFIPGTKMGFAGLKKQEDRVALIKFLEANQ